jgi:hypothetical protein
MMTFLMLVAVACLLLTLAGPDETTVVVSHPSRWPQFLFLLLLIALLLYWCLSPVSAAVIQ